MDKLKNILDGKATRWGIASAGLISNDFTNSIVGVLPPEEHLVRINCFNFHLNQ